MLLSIHSFYANRHVYSQEVRQRFSKKCFLRQSSLNCNLGSKQSLPQLQPFSSKSFATIMLEEEEVTKTRTQMQEDQECNLIS